MRAADKVVAHQRVLGFKDRGVDAVERVAPEIVIAVARGAAEIALADARLLKRLDHLDLVVFLNVLDLPQPVGAECRSPLGGGEDPFVYVKKVQNIT